MKLKAKRGTKALIDDYNYTKLQKGQIVELNLDDFEVMDECRWCKKFKDRDRESGDYARI